MIICFIFRNKFLIFFLSINYLRILLLLDFHYQYLANNFLLQNLPHFVVIIDIFYLIIASHSHSNYYLYYLEILL